jgi:hypothetical protein
MARGVKCSAGSARNTLPDLLIPVLKEDVSGIDSEGLATLVQVGLHLSSKLFELKSLLGVFPSGVMGFGKNFLQEVAVLFLGPVLWHRDGFQEIYLIVELVSGCERPNR